MFRNGAFCNTPPLLLKARKGETFVQKKKPLWGSGWNLLSAASCFLIGCSWYCWSCMRERQDAGPCIDCERQKAIAGEVYFGKKRVQEGNTGSDMFGRVV